MREIHLAQFRKKTTDRHRAGMKEGETVSKIEVPIDYVLPDNHFEEVFKEEGVTRFKVVNNAPDCNCMIEYVQDLGGKNGVTLLAQIQGPTDAKFASKQEACRAFIEINLKGTD